MGERADRVSMRQVFRYADGEVSDAEAARLRAALDADAEAAAAAEDQARLRAAVGRAMGEPRVCPLEVRNAVARMVDAGAEGGAPPRPGGRVRPWLAWAGWAVAAVLLLAGGVGWWGDGGAGDGGGAGAAEALGYVTPARLEGFTRRHRACAGDIGALHGVERFPRDVRELPHALSDFFGRPVGGAGFDLSELGYGYRVTGLCATPGVGAVHVLYQRPAADGAARTMSLWLRPYDGRTELEAGKVYALRPEGAGSDLLLWRDGDMVFYLLGDSPADVERAAAAMGRPI